MRASDSINFQMELRAESETEIHYSIRRDASLHSTDRTASSFSWRNNKRQGLMALAKYDICILTIQKVWLKPFNKWHFYPLAKASGN